jgi:hypothetical protein
LEVFYRFELYTDEDIPGLGLGDEFANDGEAINWAYYYMGAYHSPKVQLWRGDKEPLERDASDLVAEISSGGYEKRLVGGGPMK